MFAKLKDFLHISVNCHSIMICMMMAIYLQCLIHHFLLSFPFPYSDFFFLDYDLGIMKQILHLLNYNHIVIFLLLKIFPIPKS